MCTALSSALAEEMGISRPSRVNILFFGIPDGFRLKLKCSGFFKRLLSTVNVRKPKNQGCT